MLCFLYLFFLSRLVVEGLAGEFVFSRFVNNKHTSPQNHESSTNKTALQGSLKNNQSSRDYDPEKLLAAGERSVNLKRAISNRLGVTRQHDELPGICLEPLQEGATDGSRPDMEAMLKEYYSYRGWAWETGKPSKEKLIELELTQAAEDLHGP